MRHAAFEVPLARLDLFHRNPSGTAARAFREHRAGFREGEDYWIEGGEIRLSFGGHLRLVTLANWSDPRSRFFRMLIAMHSAHIEAPEVPEGLASEGG